MMATVPIRLSEGDTPRLGYWVDIAGIEFTEGEAKWIQAMPIGTWHHPIHGKITIDQQRVYRFAANANASIRGQDLNIDYDHVEGEAAGWVKQAEARTDGLWLLVEWTKKAFQAIKEKRYRYFSPDYQDVWEHPATKMRFKDVLFGGALTNRPFLKGIQPINLSELPSDEATGGQMSRDQLEALAKRLSVEFTAETSDADLQTAVLAKAQEEPAPNGDGGSGGDGGDNSNNNNNDNNNTNTNTGDNNGGDGGDGSNTDDNDNDDAGLVSASEAQLDKQLSERAGKGDPLAAALLDERKSTRKRLAALETANRLAETQLQLNELRGGKRRLSPAAEKKLAEVARSVPHSKALEMFETVRTILSEGGTVEMGESGKTDNDGNVAAGTAGKDFEDRVAKLMSENDKLDYVDAIERITLSDPELYERYRQESFAGSILSGGD